MQPSLASQVADLEHNHIMLQDICEGYVAMLYRCYLKQTGQPFNEPFTEAQLEYLETVCINWDAETGQLTASNVIPRRKY